MSKPDTSTVSSLASDPPRFTRQRAGARLIIVGGPDAGSHVDLGDRPITIGTGPETDLALSDAAVSRVHVRVACVAGAVRVTDLESKNGAFSGGNRFREMELGWGVEFTIGRTAIKVVPAEDSFTPDPVEVSLFGGLVGKSFRMRQVFALIDQVAPTNATVLIEGETGVGKEMVAEEIHRRSQRSDRPFIVFDCGAVIADLLESTLFGHTKGAFTGAVADHVGVFEEAEGGTLFLDEIGELDPHLQPALLRAVDRGVIRPVGTSIYKPVDVRIIAATNRNLADMIDDDRFREDLYYRLSVVRLSVPALRERPEDIPLLVTHFLRRRGRGDLVIPDADMERLMGYEWPGNVRQLQNRIDRALVLARDGRIEVEVPEPGRAAAAPRPNPPPAAMRQSFRTAKAEAIEAFELRYLTDLMTEHPTLATAAGAAEMDRRHLRMLLRRYGLKSD